MIIGEPKIYDGQEVEVLGESGNDGYIFIGLKSGIQKEVMKCELEDSV